jgi:surfactin synthase thioesterase subunit
LFGGVREQAMRTVVGSEPTTLYCFPFAGCATSPFSQWPKWIPLRVRIFTVALPGRGTRIREHPARRMKQLSEQLTGELLPALRGQFVMFGHSMGALLAFEVARMLRKRGHCGPSLLIASGCRAPHLPSRCDRPMSQLPDAELVAELKRTTGNLSPGLDDPELMSLFLPMIRADLEVCETYRFEADEPLAHPIVAIAGAEDSSLGQDDVGAWSVHTRSQFSMCTLPGNHLSMLDSPEMPQTMAKLIQDLPNV